MCWNIGWTTVLTYLLREIFSICTRHTPSFVSICQRWVLCMLEKPWFQALEALQISFSENQGLLPIYCLCTVVEEASADDALLGHKLDASIKTELEKVKEQAKTRTLKAQTELDRTVTSKARNSAPISSSQYYAMSCNKPIIRMSTVNPDTHLPMCSYFEIASKSPKSV